MGEFLGSLEPIGYNILIFKITNKNYQHTKKWDCCEIHHSQSVTFRAQFCAFEGTPPILGSRAYEETIFSIRKNIDKQKQENDNGRGGGGTLSPSIGRLPEIIVDI